MHLQKEKAIRLRKEGKTYSEILKVIPVAKSTLSLWLRNVGLAKRQIQKITEKKRAGQLRGALVRKNQRIEITEKLREKGRGEIGKLSQRELWLFGIALYWAEGSKEHTYGSQVVKFTNSDPKMITVFVHWLREICNVPISDITFEIYIHENHKARVLEIRKYWAKQLDLSVSYFDRIYFKKNIVKNIQKECLYYGQVRVNMRRSSTLLRTLMGWTLGVSEQCVVRKK